MKILYTTTICFLLILVGCKNQIESNDKVSKRKNATIVNQVKKIPSLEILYHDNGIFTFTDTGSFWLLYFLKGKVNFDYSPNCGHTFDLQWDSKKTRITILFDKNKTCKYDFNFDLTFKGIDSPKEGKPFGEIYQMNDSTLRIDYFYEQWRQKINEKEKNTIDTLFPSVFRLINLEE